jgi:hypothetical protein
MKRPLAIIAARKCAATVGLFADFTTAVFA